MWSRDNVTCILAATREAMAAAMAANAPVDPVQAEAYRAGFDDAIRAVAVAFGVSVPGGPQVQVLAAPRRATGDTLPGERWGRG